MSRATQTLPVRMAVVFVLGMTLGALLVNELRGPELPATWHDEQSLAGPRTYAQAVALANGEVLLIGGMDRDNPQITNVHAEILDPRSGTLRVDPSLRIGRLWQSVTTLPNDLVLIVDGTERPLDDSGWHAIAFAETYDPWSGKWQTVRTPAIARSDHAAALLRDGRVLVTGGNDGPKWVLQSEIYDPRTDTWSPAAPLPTGRTRFTAATLPDGRVLVAGGLEPPGLATDATLLYDPAADSWSLGPRMSAKRAIYSTVALPDGDILFIGGQNDGSNTAERYSVKGQRFEFAGTLFSPRMFGQAALADDGTVVFAGGIVVPERGFAPVVDVERWDPRTNLWTAGPPLRTGRAGGAMVAASGGIWLLGGAIFEDHAIASVELLR